MAQRLTSAKLHRDGLGTYFRPRALAPLGATFHDLRRMVAAGEVTRVAPGLYRLTTVQADELESIAMVGAAIPGAIVCLLTALSIHGIGTQLPPEVWIGVDRKARRPKSPGPKLRVVRFSGAALTYGVAEHAMLGVPVKLTSPARTVVDCFRYRHKLGLDVAMEALREALRLRKTTVDQIMRAAEMCRARTLLRTYLEATAP